MKNLTHHFVSFPVTAFLLIAGIAFSSCEKQEITPISTHQTEYYEDSDRIPQDGDKSDRNPQIRANKTLDRVTVSSPKLETTTTPGTFSAPHLSPVAADILPKKIFEYLDEHYTRIAIYKIEYVSARKKGFLYFLVQLSNGTKLRFSRDGQLIDENGTPVGDTGEPGVDCEGCHKSFRAVYPDKDYVQN